MNVSQYQALTDTGLTRKRNLWRRKLSEAQAKVGRAVNESFRAYWAEAARRAEAELEAIATVDSIRAHC